MSVQEPGPRITAVLGPTNTGKTYFAIERMLDHDTGMIGFPLRLLARENYDRVVAIKGARNVALVTGEERILPPTARYFICTTESMPLERPVAFLAIDEIQMCADPERGHVFTDRLLHARGQLETLFLGADTIRPILRILVPEAEFIIRPRLSQLSYSGPKKITRLPRRTAIVAFSASEVYEIAELIRRQRGGAAVVLGALSPRTRNAQVEMYQAGEVEYLVATDAIGMGLNMNIDHVAFARLGKFDGRVSRRLTASEIAQIAGRAGRHMTDGTFGTIADLGAMPAEIVEAVESHQFEPLRAVQWRNSELSFKSPEALLKSLDRYPDRPELSRSRAASDQVVLAQLIKDPDIARLARHPDAVRQLWEICQVPDFRKTLADAHTRLLGRLYGYLMAPGGKLPTDWVADQVARLDRVDGDIDTLMARIAHVRTWTYVSNRGDWLVDAGHWQARTRALEDRISDALHERLTQRFVDRRAAALTRIKDSGDLHATIGADGDVAVGGEYLGRLAGFRFVPDSTDTAEGRRALISAANRVLRGEIAQRVHRVASDAADRFDFDSKGRITWGGEPLARLRPGKSAIAPQIEVIASDYLTADQRERIRVRLVAWLDALIDARLGALTAMNKAELTGAARGLAFRLTEALGSLPRRDVRALARELSHEDRSKLRRAGVRLGMESIFLPPTIKPKAAQLRALLWANFHDRPHLPPPPPGLNTVDPDPEIGRSFYEVCGFRVLGPRAVRIDILDRLAIQIRRAARSEPFTLSAEMVSQVGLSNEQTAEIVVALGYAQIESDGGLAFVHKAKARKRAAKAAKNTPPPPPPPKRSAPRRPRQERRRETAVDPNSPFAILRELTGIS